MSYRERRAARAERLREWADKRRAKSAAGFASADRIASAIPMGQPVLVGHHSERRHRRDLARIDAGMRSGVESQQMAASMSSRADEIDRQADGAIYSDDVDAIERLRERIAGLESERARIKVVNAAIRKHTLAGLPADFLTAAERGELLTLMRVAPYQNADTKGFPAYVLQNLGGNITRQRARLASLSGTPASAPGSDAGNIVWGTAATATARAGLTVTAGMTTPTRAGKKPRPVWNVTGNLANWRPLLMQLGGSWYRGAFSFWDDPSAGIEQAVQDAEQRDRERGYQLEVPTTDTDPGRVLIVAADATGEPQRILRDIRIGEQS